MCKKIQNKIKYEAYFKRLNYWLSWEFFLGLYWGSGDSFLRFTLLCLFRELILLEFQIIIWIKFNSILEVTLD